MGRKNPKAGLQILELHKTDREIARVKEGQKILDVYRGDHEPHVDVAEFDLFKKNIFRKIIDKKIGVLYQSKPRREIKNAGGRVLFQKSIEREMTRNMRRIMRSIELFGACYVDWVNGEMFTPIEVFHDDDGRTMTMKRNADAENTFQWVYDENTVLLFMDKTAYKQLQPAQLVKYEKEQSDYKRVKELAELQLEITKMGTFWKVATVLQAVDQVFTDDVELKSMNMSPEVVTFKNRDSEIETVNFKADLLQIRENFREAQEAIYEIAGVPRVSVVGDMPSRSAKELMAKWYPMVETYKTLCSEYGLIEGLVVRDQVGNLFGKKFDPAWYSVTYDRDFLPVMERKPEETKMKLENNIITLKTLLREENPTLSEAELDALMAANAKENQKFKPKITEAPVE